MASDQGLPGQRAQEERAAREAAVRRVVRGFDPGSPDDAPFRPAEFVILSMIAQRALDKHTSVMGKRPQNLWWVSFAEGTLTPYVQRWDPNDLTPRRRRGVSVRGNEMLVLPGEPTRLVGGRLDDGSIDVTGYPGPWNAEARRMAGELKRYLGSDEENARAVLEADQAERSRSSTFTSRLSRMIFDDPNAQAARSRASEAELERAKQIVEGRVQSPSGGSSATAVASGQSNLSDSLSRIPRWVWVVIGIGLLFLLMKGR